MLLSLNSRPESGIYISDYRTAGTFFGVGIRHVIDGNGGRGPSMVG